MKMFFKKFYTCLIYMFFALFLLLIRIDAKDKVVFYSIGLVLASIIIAIIPFFLNNCENVKVRRFYLLGFIAIGIFGIIKTVYLLGNFYEVNNIGLFNNIMSWILRFSQALIIAATIFMVIYLFKNFFKKKFELQKDHIYQITMFLNLFVAILLSYYSGFSINEIYDPITFKFIGYDIYFKDFSKFLIETIIVSVVYISSFTGLILFSYHKFEKNK